MFVKHECRYCAAEFTLQVRMPELSDDPNDNKIYYVIAYYCENCGLDV